MRKITSVKRKQYKRKITIKVKKKNPYKVGDHVYMKAGKWNENEDTKLKKGL